MGLTKTMQKVVNEGVTQLEEDQSLNLLKISPSPISTFVLVRQGTDEAKERENQKGTIMSNLNEPNLKSKYYLCKK